MNTTEMICEQCEAEFTRIRARKRCDECIKKMHSSEWIRVKKQSRKKEKGDEWNDTEDWIRRERRWLASRKELVKINDREEWKRLLERRADKMFNNTQMMEWVKDRKHCTEKKKDSEAADKRYSEANKFPSTKDMPYDV